MYLHSATKTQYKADKRTSSGHWLFGVHQLPVISDVPCISSHWPMQLTKFRFNIVGDRSTLGELYTRVPIAVSCQCDRSTLGELHEYACTLH